MAVSQPQRASAAAHLPGRLRAGGGAAAPGAGPGGRRRRAAGGLPARYGVGRPAPGGDGPPPPSRPRRPYPGPRPSPPHFPCLHPIARHKSPVLKPPASPLLLGGLANALFFAHAWARNRLYWQLDPCPPAAGGLGRGVRRGLPLPSGAGGAGGIDSDLEEEYRTVAAGMRQGAAGWGAGVSGAGREHWTSGGWCACGYVRTTLPTFPDST